MKCFKDRAKGFIGNILTILLPQRAKSIAKENFTLSGPKRSVVDKLILFRMVQKNLVEKDYKTISTYHSNFWSSNNAESFHEKTTDRFESIFLKYNTDVVDELECLLENEKSIETLCEIGTGSGQVITYLSKRLQSIKHFVGLDLSQSQIDKLIRNNCEPSINFVCGNAINWIPKSAKKNTVFFTNMGVLEYFTKNDIENLLNYISKNLSPSIFIIIEPLSHDHDLQSHIESKCFGGEHSFSHNYPHIFKDAGFHITYLTESTIPPHRIIKLCAQTS